MLRWLTLALPLLLAACIGAPMDSGIVRKHRLIEAGMYTFTSEGKRLETFEFQSDGKGRKITRYLALDSTVWLFDWETVDWSDGRLRLMTRNYSRQIGTNRERIDSKVYQDLKDVSDTSFSLCYSDRETCESPLAAPWKFFRREG